MGKYICTYIYMDIYRHIQIVLHVYKQQQKIYIYMKMYTYIHIYIPLENTTMSSR